MNCPGPMPNRFRFWITVILLSLILVGRACIFRPATNFPGSYFNNGNNAAWLSVEWVQKPVGPDEIANLANALDRLEISQLFVFASYLRRDGSFNATYSFAADFTQTFRTIQPDVNIQAWIGIPLKQGGVLNHGYVDLANITTRQIIAAFCAELIQSANFDGIHLDPEPVRDGDPDLLKLLDDVHQTIGFNKALSIATRRIWPIFPDAALPVVGNVAWSAGYYREVAERVDQLAVMTYDSGMPLPELYRQWGRFQVIEISRAVDDKPVDLYFGIPTSEERTWTHLPDAENMTSGLQGVINGLNDASSRPLAVTGVAIYPYWETDENEWATYESLWLGK